MNGPTKITLKSQTNMTLNARFTAIMKSAKSPMVRSSDADRSGGLRPASEKNRRLAAQMEKRTTYSSNRGDNVSRPKRWETEPYRAPIAKHQSVMERLGSKRTNVTDRLSFRGNSSRGPLSGRISKPYNNNNSTRGSYRGNARGRGRGRGLTTRVWQGKPSATKDELDNALDSYMKDKKKAD